MTHQFKIGGGKASSKLGSHGLRQTFYYPFSVSGPPVAVLFILDNALSDGEIHGNLDCINVPGCLGAGRKNNMPYLSGKVGNAFRWNGSLFCHRQNVCYFCRLAKLPAAGCRERGFEVPFGTIKRGLMGAGASCPGPARAESRRGEGGKLRP